MNANIGKIVAAAVALLAVIAVGMNSCNGNGGRNARQRTESKENTEETKTNVSGSARATNGATTYKLYIENSGSMNGYFNSEAGARDARLTLFQLAQSLKCKELSFINSIEIPIDGEPTSILKDMTLADFKNYGRQGDPTSSDIANLLKTVVKSTPSSGHISLIASDFIFSPSSATAAISLGPAAEKSTIKNIFENAGLSVAILKTTAQFDGKFFTGHYEKQGKNWRETNYQISQTRPFYIWAIGGAEEIRGLIEHRDLGSAGVEDILCLTQTAQAVDYRLNQNSTKYDIDHSDNKHAVNATVGGRNNAFELKIKADIGGIALPEEYKTDPANYSTSNSNFEVTDVRAEKDGWYILSVKSNTMTAGKLSVNLMAQTEVPAWVRRSSMQSGEWDIRNDGNEQRTFGFKELVEGVMEAMLTDGNENYTTITIKIN